MSSPKSIFTAPPSPKTNSTNFDTIAQYNGGQFDPPSADNNSYFALPLPHSSPGERIPTGYRKSPSTENGADGGKPTDSSITPPQDPRSRSVPDPQDFSSSPTESRSQDPPRSVRGSFISGSSESYIQYSAYTCFKTEALIDDRLEPKMQITDLCTIVSKVDCR